MSTQGTRRIVWRGGEDDFCLAKTGDIFALEAACGNTGIAGIMRRLEDGTWFLNDVRETIRIGLIGGGKPPEKAMRLVKLHVDGQPLAASVLLAHTVLAAVLIGVPDDPVGKTQAADAETMAEVSSTTTAASAAPPFSESVQPSNGPQASLTDIPSGSLPPSSTATTAPTPPPTPPPIL